LRRHGGERDALHPRCDDRWCRSARDHHFQAAGPREGAIVNEVFEDEAGELRLKFYCYLALRDKTPNGPEEQAEQAQFDSDQGYKAALLSTLKRTREMLALGTLDRG
jgi:hypothetical protein